MATGVHIMDDQNHVHCRNRISWSAIVIGALVGVGLGFLLNLFGVTIGLSAFSMSNEGAGTLAVGGLLGLIISTIIAMFMSGFTAGYLGRLFVPRRNLGVVYGFATWSLALILTALVTTYVGSYVNSYTTTVTRNTIVVTQEQPATQNTDRASRKDQQIASVTPKEITGGIAVGTFIVFALFFIGALSSCFGAHYGMSCRSED